MKTTLPQGPTRTPRGFGIYPRLGAVINIIKRTLEVISSYDLGLRYILTPMGLRLLTYVL